MSCNELNYKEKAITIANNYRLWMSKPKLRDVDPAWNWYFFITSKRIREKNMRPPKGDNKKIGNV